MLVSVNSRRRLPIDRPRSMPSVPSVPLKRANALPVRRNVEIWNTSRRCLRIWRMLDSVSSSRERPVSPSKPSRRETSSSESSRNKRKLRSKRDLLRKKRKRF